MMPSDASLSTGLNVAVACVPANALTSTYVDPGITIATPNEEGNASNLAQQHRSDVELSERRYHEGPINGLPDTSRTITVLSYGGV